MLTTKAGGTISQQAAVHSWLVMNAQQHAATGMCQTGFADRLLANSQQNLFDIYLLLHVQY
jgi:hypothetical protein